MEPVETLSVTPGNHCLWGPWSGPGGKEPQEPRGVPDTTGVTTRSVGPGGHTRTGRLRNETGLESEEQTYM